MGGANQDFQEARKGGLPPLKQGKGKSPEPPLLQKEL